MQQQNWKQNSTPTQLKEVLLEQLIQVVMPDDILEKVKYLCKAISRVEWSGILFYDIEGSIKDPDNMVITLKDILPMNKGTQAYTEYELDDRYIDYVMENEEAMDWKIGHIHSHNTMDVFFSGTDMSELQDNSASHNFYLSLIVNNYMDFCAKVAFRGTVQSETKFLSYMALDENGDEYEVAKNKFTISKQNLYMHNCMIGSSNTELEVPEDFQNKVEGIIEAAKPKPTAKAVAGFNQYMTGGAWGQQPQEDTMKTSFDKLAIALFLGDDTCSFLEEALGNLKVSSYSTPTFAIDLAGSVLHSYLPLYDKYYPLSTESCFLDVTYKLIETLELEETFHTYLGDSIEAIKSMLNKF